ncbi:MAG: nucleotide sugar dehydrogenase [Gemmatimonadetes bacterium]|uniref:Nucleotide sugar dehydrogenase n=1 Tax=Candidatus Kutchimonas denitrificans TaxID=3056748 RepID=A0AAE4Z7H6_9BACT|nr:nucleotide sugar dehydrogenase [Gemmatimonadota bacterium]NIR73882.1 nucleotide sugar dehydrogenase [Candidatus Kutchimonas denitrificans]NIR99688.1 nucleotide sugar dehydrogenase [Gemmatimonadota bacterium]NIT65273.1 nucleotide sugar dehydrogenase [Gemmatimonadota bacterium]NIW73722.1 nucleotide sugar dehydrogenase [Gemmatimonadota bacterium]
MNEQARVLIEQIESRQARVGVVGLGYVGLPLAVEFAEAGFSILGFEVARDKVEAVNAGNSYVGDVPEEQLAAAVEAGRLEATLDYDRLAEADAICICVPTPLNKTGDPDVSFIMTAANSLQRTVRAGQLVVLESTTYPGTTRELLLPALAGTRLEVGKDFFLAFSPERVDPGNPVYKIHNTPKVVGGITADCAECANRLYSTIIEQVILVSSTEAAELTKLLENTFRSVNIALANEMAIVCDKLDVDVWEVIEAAATKPFGFMKFTPGPGLGGHCIPVDPHYLSWKMKTLDYKTRLIELASEINAEMPRYVSEKVADLLNDHGRPVRGSRVVVVGAAYKPDTNDTRESPALDIIRLLAEKGAEVIYHDPMVPNLRHEGQDIESMPLDEKRLAGADVVVIVTDHTDIDYDLIRRSGRPVLDTRNVLQRPA